MFPNHCWKQLFSLCVAAVLTPLACVKGDPEIPCQSDEHCPQGYTCLASGTCQKESDIVRVSLSVEHAGNGEGTVTTDDDSISCGDRCSKTFIKGTQVTLHATEGLYSRFAGWGGGCEGTDPSCSVTLAGDTVVTANFGIIEYPLMVERGGTGTGTVSSDVGGISCGSQCVGSFTRGAKVTLTASPSSRNTFAGWTGACMGTTPTCVLTIDAMKSTRAMFEADKFMVSVARSGSGGGAITSNVGGINCGTTCGAMIASGTQLELTVASDPSAEFLGWSGPCTGTGSTCRFRVDGPATVGAQFMRHQYPLTVTVAGNGRVRTPDGHIDCGDLCTTMVDAGTEVILRADPGPESVLADWSVSACDVGSLCKLPVTGPMTIDATFNVPVSWAVSLDTQGFGPSALQAQGALFIAGTTTSTGPAGQPIGFIGKFPGVGDPAVAAPAWTKNIGGGNTVVSADLFVDQVGNLYVTGFFTGAFVDFGDVTQRLSSLGERDGFLAKYDPDGRLLWARRFGGGLDDRPWAIAAQSTGRVIVAGTFTTRMNIQGSATRLASHGGQDGFLIAYDADGTFAWQLALGGADLDSTYDVAVDLADGISATGVFRGSADLGLGEVAGAGDTTGYFVSLLADGTPSAATPLDENTVGAALTADPSRADGAVLVAASIIISGFPDTDLAVYRCLTDGTIEDAQRFGGLEDELPQSIDVSPLGDALVTGQFAGDSVMGTFPLVANGGTDSFVTKLDSALNVLWSTSLGGETDDFGYIVRGVGQHGVLLSGNFTGTLDLGIGQLQAEPGSVASYLIRLGPTGETCTDPIPLAVPNGGFGMIVEPFDTTGYRGDYAASCTYGSAANSGPDITYRLDLDRPTHVKATATGFDTVLEISPTTCGTPNAAGSPLCNDDEGAGVLSSLVEPSEPLGPGTYFIDVDAYQAAGTTTQGPGILTITLSAP